MKHLRLAAVAFAHLLDVAAVLAGVLALGIGHSLPRCVGRSGDAGEQSPAGEVGAARGRQHPTGCQQGTGRRALGQALGTLDRPSLIEVKLPPFEPSPAMQRLAENLRARL